MYCIGFFGIALRTDIFFVRGLQTSVYPAVVNALQASSITTSTTCRVAIKFSQQQLTSSSSILHNAISSFERNTAILHSSVSRVILLVWRRNSVFTL